MVYLSIGICVCDIRSIWRNWHQQRRLLVHRFSIDDFRRVIPIPERHHPSVPRSKGAIDIHRFVPRRRDTRRGANQPTNQDTDRERMRAFRVQEAEITRWWHGNMQMIAFLSCIWECSLTRQTIRCCCQVKRTIKWHGRHESKYICKNVKQDLNACWK